MSELIINAVKATFTASRTRVAETAKATATALAAAATSAQTSSFKAIGVDDSHGVIIAIGAVADNVDLDKEVLEKASVVTMAYDFCADAGRVFKANHTEALKADLVCSWPGAPILKSGIVLKAGEAVPDGDVVIGINIEKGNESHWFVGVRPHDAEVLEIARKGGIAGLSWGATVKKTPVTA